MKTTTLLNLVCLLSLFQLPRCCFRVRKGTLSPFRIAATLQLKRTAVISPSISVKPTLKLFHIFSPVCFCDTVAGKPSNVTLGNYYVCLETAELSQVLCSPSSSLRQSWSFMSLDTTLLTMNSPHLKRSVSVILCCRPLFCNYF